MILVSITIQSLFQDKKNLRHAKRSTKSIHQHRISKKHNRRLGNVLFMLVFKLEAKHELLSLIGEETRINRLKRSSVT